MLELSTVVRRSNQQVACNLNEEVALLHLDSLITEPSRLAREAVRRRKPLDEVSVTAEQVAAHEADGWKVDRHVGA